MQERKPYRKKSKLGYGERHRDGKLVRRPVGGRRDNRAVAIRASSRRAAEAIKHGRLDGRSTIGKLYRHSLAELKSHLGEDCSIPQARLCEQGARLGLLASLAWAEVQQARSIIKGDGIHPAADFYLRVAKQQRDLLNLLGIKRPQKRTVTLSEYLAEAGQTSTDIPQPSEAELVLEDEDIEP
jgi:hypothetical protein